MEGVRPKMEGVRHQRKGKRHNVRIGKYKPRLVRRSSTYFALQLERSAKMLIASQKCAKESQRARALALQCSQHINEKPAVQKNDLENCEVTCVGALTQLARSSGPAVG